MNTKNVFKNLAILLIISIGFFSIYSFTTIDADTNDLTSYDQSFYQAQNNNKVFSYLSPINNDNDKCGGDKKDKEAKDSKCGDGSNSEKSSSTERKCGDDKKSSDNKTDKKDGEEKEMKCGDGSASDKSSATEGKCGDDKKEEKSEEGDKKANKEKEMKCGAGKCGK